jgi:hypothetical protein
LLAAALIIAALVTAAAIVSAILILTRLGIAATAVLVTTTRVTAPSGNVQNLTGIDIVGIVYPIDFGDIVWVNPEHTADAEECVTILDGVVSATATAALSWRSRING